MKEKKRTLSKKLAVTVLYVWVATVIFSCFSLWFSKDASAILLSVSGSLGIVLSGYFTKSFLENKEKYCNKETDQKGEIENYEYTIEEQTM